MAPSLSATETNAQLLGPVVPGLAVAGAGAVVAGMTPVPLAVYACSAGAACVSVAGAASRIRRGERAEMLESARMALAEASGRAEGIVITGKRWRGGWIGSPARVSIVYDPVAGVRFGDWGSKVGQVLRTHLHGEYQLVGHSRTRHRLRLRLVPGGASAPPALRSVTRAERAVTELLGPTARMTGSQTEGEELQAFEVVHQAGARLAAAGYRARVERVISTMMPGRWRALWDLEGDTVRFEQRPHLPSSVWLPQDLPEDCEDLLENYSEVRIPFGVDEDGAEMTWAPARSPQMLITGMTGSGKTSTGHAILGKITQHGWPVIIVDGKRVEYLAFRTWPNVQYVATTIEQQVATIHRVWALMEYRYRLLEDGRARIEDFEPLVLFLDEFADFVQNVTDWYAGVKGKGDPTRAPSLREVGSLLRKARTARIHVVMSLQRPDVQLLGGQGGEMRSNMGQRLSIGRLDPAGAMMMWGSAAVGVAIPRAVMQRATGVNADGRPVEMQCYRFPGPMAPEGTPEHELLQRLRPAQARHPRLVIVPPEHDVFDAEDGEPPPLRFEDFAQAEWDLASARPDLDPVRAFGGEPVDGREVSSMLASLGLVDGVPRPGEYPGLHLVDDHAAVPAGNGEEADDADDYQGYGPAGQVSPWDLAVGDLVQPEEEVEGWAVVDEDVVDDPAAPGMACVSWRGDDDSAGSMSVSEDGTVLARRAFEGLEQ